MNNKFCSIPWSHLQVDPDGSVRPCCIMQGTPNTRVGNLNSSTLPEIWNSEGMKSLRLNMLNGVRDARCQVCDNYEDAGLESFRSNVNKHMNTRLTGVKEAIEQTDRKTGHAPIVNMEYWDFRFSNFCNFKCRSCGPAYSTAWYADAAELNIMSHNSPAPKAITWLNSVADRIDQLRPYVGIVKEIYFAGGEPLIMDEHYKVLDMLLEAGRTDVLIRYNTNMSTLKYKGKDLINDYWSKFKNVSISGSIDAMGSQAEYIRSGTNWKQVDKNIRRLVEAKRSGILQLMVNVTISNMNILYLEELLDYFIEAGVVENLNSYSARPWQFWFNLVFTPEHYCISNMPDPLKAEVRRKFDLFEEKMKREKNIKWSFFTDLYPILDKAADPNMIPTFVRKMKELDNIRGETIEKELPELWEYYKPFDPS